jgi:hypothetical protein
VSKVKTEEGDQQLQPWHSTLVEVIMIEAITTDSASTGISLVTTLFIKEILQSWYFQLKKLSEFPI